MPYLGAYWAPNDRLYFQTYLQVDVDANGNRVAALGEPFSGSNPPPQFGRLNEQTLMYVDFSVGYWLMRDDSARFVTGVIPTLEFHYTTSLQDADIVQVNSSSFGTFQVGNTFNRLDIPNLTAGTSFRLGMLSYLTVAGVVPLQDRIDNRQFDSEFVVQLNRLF
jgi:hypothetical protein